MRRLVTRLTLGMLALAVITATIIIFTTQLGLFLHFRSLPADIRQVLESQFDTPRENAFQEAFRGLRNVSVVSIVLVGLVASVFARVLAKVLTKPIEQVSRASAQIAWGDLGARVPEPERFDNVEVVTLTQNFNQMADALQTYERERSDMIASIAHDLRTPLSAIQIRLELLKEHVVPYSEAEVDLLLKQTLLLGRLANDLRTLSLADAGKLSLNLQTLELGSCVTEMLENYVHHADKTGVELLFERPEGEIHTHADAQRLTQIFSNLLDNAFRVVPDGGVIRLRLQKQGNTVTLSVEDDGPGISAELLPRIFDRFVQGKDKTGSSGLGLAIVKTLVDLHGERGKPRRRWRALYGLAARLNLPGLLGDRRDFCGLSTLGQADVVGHNAYGRGCGDGGSSHTSETFRGGHSIYFVHPNRGDADPDDATTLAGFLDGMTTDTDFAGTSGR